MSNYWVPSLAPKQLELFNDFHRFLLVHGPRRSSKTWAIMHKILRHAFDNNGARVAMVAKTNKNAKAGGVWKNLCERAIPEWTAANIGFKVTDGPKVTGDTRMSFVKVRNRYGTESEIQLHSVDYCPEVEEKFKGTEFSMFYFSELSNFEDRIVFDITAQSLRMNPQIPFESHCWIGDTNPPDDGTNNWMHQIWFKDKENENYPDKEYQTRIHQIPFSLDDNIYLDARDRADLEGMYRHRKSLYNRYVLGLWEEDLTDSLFSDVFIEDTHVIGNIHKPNRKDWDVIVPSQGCFELLLGLDPGNVNHSGHIIEKMMTPSGEPVFAVLDEVVSVGKKVSIREFTAALMDRMKFWMAFIKTNYHRDIRWKTWADTSVMNYRSAAEVDEALIMRNLSNRLIDPRSAPKFAGSVQARVDTLYRLLWEKRVYISACCTDTISMLKALPRGGNKTEPVALRSRHKHPFDSLTYAIFSEEPQALALLPSVGKGVAQRGLIHVG